MCVCVCVCTCDREGGLVAKGLKREDEMALTCLCTHISQVSTVEILRQFHHTLIADDSIITS